VGAEPPHDSEGVYRSPTTLLHSGVTEPNHQIFTRRNQIIADEPFEIGIAIVQSVLE